MIHKIDVGDKDFSNVILGKKSFVIVRKNGYHIGDLLAINEYNEQEEHTGNSCLVYIDYITEEHPFLRDGYVAMSIKPCEVGRFDRPYDMSIRCANYSVPYATNGDAK